MDFHEIKEVLKEFDFELEGEGTQSISFVRKIKWRTVSFAYFSNTGRIRIGCSPDQTLIHGFRVDTPHEVKFVLERLTCLNPDPAPFLMM